MCKDASCELSLLCESIKAYSEGFKKDPRHYYSGINAVTFIYLHRHLSGNDEQFEQVPVMERAVRWAVQSALAKETLHHRDFWARTTLGDLDVLSGDTEDIEKAYKDAIAIAGNDWFALDSIIEIIDKYL